MKKKKKEEGKSRGGKTNRGYHERSWGSWGKLGKPGEKPGKAGQRKVNIKSVKSNVSQPYNPAERLCCPLPVIYVICYMLYAI